MAHFWIFFLYLSPDLVVQFVGVRVLRIFIACELPYLVSILRFSALSFMGRHGNRVIPDFVCQRKLSIYCADQIVLR